MGLEKSCLCVEGERVSQELIRNTNVAKKKRNERFFFLYPKTLFIV